MPAWPSLRVRSTMAVRPLGNRRLRVGEQPGLDLVLEYLANLGARQVRPGLDLLGSLDAAQPSLDEGTDVFAGDVLAGVELDDRGDALAPLVVGQPDDRAVQHRGVGEQGLLDLG